MVPDYRTTLYWNPTVKLDDTGQATIEFYTSDAPADYDISIEGVTQTGENRTAPATAAARIDCGSAAEIPEADFSPTFGYIHRGKACIFDCIQTLPLGNCK